MNPNHPEYLSPSKKQLKAVWRKYYKDSFTWKDFYKRFWTTEFDIKWYIDNRIEEDDDDY